MVEGMLFSEAVNLEAVTYKSILQLLEAQAKARPDRPAIAAPGRRTMGYAALYGRVLDTIAALRSHGVGRQDRVAIVLPNGPELAVVFLAGAGGATAAPLNPDSRESEFKFYLEDLGVKLLIAAAGESLAARSAAKSLGIPVADLAVDIEDEAGCFTLSPGDAAVDPGQETAEPGSIALVLHTSGTTARPKIVPQPEANLCRAAKNIARSMELTERDRCLAIMPLFHIQALMSGLMCSMAAGSTVICTPRFSAVKFFPWLDETKPTWYSAGPAFHQAILALAPKYEREVSASTLRFVRSFSAPIAPMVLAELERVFRCPAIEGYGMSEATQQIACNPLPPRKRKHGSMGVPVGIEVAVADAGGHLLEPMQEGEFVLRGPCVTSGYENNREANESAFRDGWFRTGDLGYLDSEGYLFFKGRIKEMINRGGENISPREVDEALLEHPDVVQAVAFAMPHRILGEDVAAAVVTAQNSTLTEAGLRGFLTVRLADFKIPRRIVFVDDIPEEPTGKLRRVGLAEALGLTSEEVPAASEVVSPRSPVEEKILEIWQEALGRTDFGIEDDFFQLGGESLAVLSITAGVERAFGITLPMGAMFDVWTVAAMAAEVASANPEADKNPALEAKLCPEPGKQHEPFPLTRIQEAYWTGRNAIFELGNVSSHRYFECDGEALDLDRLEHAWNRVIDRHDMLRAVIQLDGMQRILETTPRYKIERLDLRGLDAGVRETQLSAARHRLSHEMMPTDRWPAFRICVSLLGGGLTRLHFSFDYLTTDAASFNTLSRELAACYQDPTTEMAPIELSYRDYVLAERAVQKTDGYARAKQYWWGRIDSLPPAPDLPLAILPAAVKQPRFTRREMTLVAEDWDRIKARAATRALTPSAVVATAYAETLRGWSDRPSFTLNVTLFHRHAVHPQVDQLVGDFTTLSLLEIPESAAGASFEQHARRLQDQSWRDIEHRDINGVEVLRELARRRGRANEAAMPVVFTSKLGIGEPSESVLEKAGLGRRGYSITQTPQVRIDCQVSEIEGSLRCNWDAVESLYPPGMLDQMFAAFGGLLEGLAERENAWAEKPLLALPARPPQPAAIVAPTTETLHSMFTNQAERTPNSPAVIAPDTTLTYAELRRRAAGLGARLRRMSAAPNALVAIVLPKGWEQVVAALGVLYSGAAYLPVDPSLPAERLRYLLEDGECGLAVTNRELDAAIDWPSAVERVRVDETETGTLDEPVARPDDLAYVIYTSGSTGNPKGVMIEHRQAANTIRDINRRFGVGPGDRVLAISSLSFDLSVYDIFGTLAAGAAIVVPEPTALRNPALWAELIDSHRVTIWNSVPALMDLLTDYASTSSVSLRSIRLALLSGDWIPTALPERVKAITGGAQVISLGGATEASIWSICYPVEKTNPTWDSIPYGRALSNQSFYVLNEKFEECPAWATGELFIGGDGVARGYWRDPEKTRASFIDRETGERIYRTGDLGRWLPDGNIEFLGRRDQQVKVQGYRVELGEIEAQLQKHPGVESAVVTASAERHGNKRLQGYVTAAEGTALDVDELQAHLAARLPDYMVPSTIVVLDTFPLTANGKVNRQTLETPRAAVAERIEAPAPVSASPDLIGRIAPIVSAGLKVESLMPDTNLLEAGATSVDIIRIANRLDTDLGFRPDIDRFYRNPTINGLVALFTQGRPAAMSETTVLPPAPDLILDPEERERFRDSQPGVRNDLQAAGSVDLGDTPLRGPLQEQRAERRTYREFLQTPVPKEDLGKLLASLREDRLGEKPKYFYPSAGALYPVQTYVHVKPNRVTGTPGGVYYFHPVEHCLVLITPGDPVDRMVYGRFVNRPIYDSAAFGVYQIVQLRAIQPLYGDNSIRYATLEAGYMSQLLMMAAPASDIGLCPIGSLDFERIRPAFCLDESHMFVHCLLGGPIDRDADGGWAPVVGDFDVEAEMNDEREEGYL
jgi:amino acid adenylation domain-containing protein